MASVGRIGRERQRAAEEAVAAAVGHPRYGGQYLPVWRILVALEAGWEPPAVRWALHRLEAQGSVECRRGSSGQLEWRARAPADGRRAGPGLRGAGWRADGAD